MKKGYDFGKILASQILIRFLQEYGKNPSSFNPQIFDSFQFKLPEIFRNMIIPILDHRLNFIPPFFFSSFAHSFHLYTSEES